MPKEQSASIHMEKSSILLCQERIVVGGDKRWFAFQSGESLYRIVANPLKNMNNSGIERDAGADKGTQTEPCEEESSPSARKE